MIAQVRSFFHAHPAYSTALGLGLAGLGLSIAGDYDGAWQALTMALGVLGVRLAAKPAA